MTLTNYIKEIDVLEIEFKKCDTPIVKQLSNGVELNFDNNYNLSCIVLPNFCQMVHIQYSLNTTFNFERAIFSDENHVVLVIQVNNNPIQVRIDLSELNK